MFRTSHVQTVRMIKHTIDKPFKFCECFKRLVYRLSEQQKMIAKLCVWQWTETWRLMKQGKRDLDEEKNVTEKIMKKDK